MRSVGPYPRPHLPFPCLRSRLKRGLLCHMTPTGSNRLLLPITDGKREQISSAQPRGAFDLFRRSSSCRAYVFSFISYFWGSRRCIIYSPPPIRHLSDPMAHGFGCWSQAKEVGRLVEDQISGDLPTFVGSSPTATTAKDEPTKGESKQESKDEYLTKDELLTTMKPRRNSH